LNAISLLKSLGAIVVFTEFSLPYAAYLDDD